MESSRFGPEPVCSSMIVSVRPPAAPPVPSSLRSSLRQALAASRCRRAGRSCPAGRTGRSPSGSKSTLSIVAPGPHRHGDQEDQPGQQDDQDVARPEPAALAAGLGRAAAGGDGRRGPRRGRRRRAALLGRAGGWDGITRVSSGRGAEDVLACGRVGWPADPGLAALAVEPAVVGSVLGTAVPGTIGHGARRYRAGHDRRRRLVTSDWRHTTTARLWARPARRGGRRRPARRSTPTPTRGGTSRSAGTPREPSRRGW